MLPEIGSLVAEWSGECKPPKILYNMLVVFCIKYVDCVISFALSTSFVLHFILGKELFC